MKKAVISFGRLNPPTIGHQKLIDKVVELARANNATPLVYLSHTQNAKKDPLEYGVKVSFARKAFGSIVTPTSARTIIEVMKELEGKGYTHVTLVAGSDRVPEFKSMFARTVGKDYKFDKAEVVSAGERDPDAEGVEGMSASKLRALAASDNKAAFMRGIPPKLSPADGERLYKAIRKGMMVEELNFDLETFVETLDVDSIEFNELDEEDIDEVLTLTQRLKKSRVMKRLAPRFKRLRAIKAKRMAPPERLQQRARKKAIALIRKRAAGEMGAHYTELSPAAKITVDRLIQKRLPLVGKLAQRLLPVVRKAELERLKRVRTPQASDKQEAYEVSQDKDVKDRKGTQPAKYFKDLAPSTKVARDIHFQKGREKASDDPSAYKPAPGDKKAETKPSKHTQKFKAMFGEQYYNGQNLDGPDMALNRRRISMISGEKQVKLNDAFEKLVNEGEMADRVRARHKAEKERIKSKHDRELEAARIQDIRAESLDEKFAKYSTSSIAPRNNYTIEQKSQEGLKKKAEKTGIPYGILKKVYDRGVAAWRTGHRPGTTPQQWGFARVNSFATGGKTRTTADADLWKQVRKEAVRVGPYFGKADVTENTLSLNWKNEDPAKYATHLSSFFGQPDSITSNEVVWEAKDGFKRIVVKDEYILHGSPAPHYDFVYCYIDLFVPNKFATALAESSGSILIDFLKGEVGARCGSITANATTLNYVLDVVAGRVAPSKAEYEKRIKNMSSMFERGEKYEVSWWPDVTGDADPKNPYYKDTANEHFKPCGCEINASEDFKLTRLGSNPGKFKRLVTKHLGDKAAEKIGASDGNKIMAIAKKKGDKNLFRQGSFIKNFYGNTNEQKITKYERSGHIVIDGHVITDHGKEGRSTYGRYTVKDPDYKKDPKEVGMHRNYRTPDFLSFSTLADVKKWVKTQPKKSPEEIAKAHQRSAEKEKIYTEEMTLDEVRKARSFGKEWGKKVTFTNFSHNDLPGWENIAKNHKKLEIKKIPHPKGHDANYYIAVDKDGNKKGNFDGHTGKGRIYEEVENTTVSLDEAFTLAMATPAGMGSIMTAADMGIKIKGGYADHPTVMETGGAGEWGTDKLTKRYKKDTPGQDLEEDIEFGPTEEEFEPTGEEVYEDWDEPVMEAEYQGRKVTLGKPFLTPGGPKKRAVYVTNDKGNVVKVNFGDPNLSIKRDDPERRKSFRARHNCDDPGPRWKARYWSCKFWSRTPVSKL